MAVLKQKEKSGHFINASNEQAKEEAKKKEEKSQMRKNKCQLQTNEVSSSRAFPTRMAKKCQVDLIKSHLPESPAKKVAVVAELIESPTTRSRLERKGLIPSAENREEADVALSVMRDAISATKSQRSNDSRAATQTALGFLVGDKVKEKRMKTKVSKMLNINRKRIGRAFIHRKKVLKSKKSCWTYTERKTRSDAISTEHRKLAYEFWACADVSRTTPNKKDIVRKRLAPKVYVTHARQILEKLKPKPTSNSSKSIPTLKWDSVHLRAANPFMSPRHDLKTKYTCGNKDGFPVVHGIQTTTRRASRTVHRVQTFD